MHEYPTDAGKEEREKVHSPTEAGDSQRMGGNGKRDCGGGEVRDTCWNPVPVEEEAGGRGRRVSTGDPDQGRSSHSGLGERKSQAQGGPGSTGTGTDGLEKKDELGLAGRRGGEHYTESQKQGIIEVVERLREESKSVVGSLRQLGVARSTYYEWKGRSGDKGEGRADNKLLRVEEEAIIGCKQKEPHLSHRHISGLLRQDDIWVSASSCYRVLKGQGMVDPQDLREAPWKEPRYEPFRPNQIWGEDWTRLLIRGERHYLLTVIDFFSRYVVAWGVVQTVTRREVMNLVALAIMDQGLTESQHKPILRTDPGSPNMAKDVRTFFNEIGIRFSRAGYTGLRTMPGKSVSIGP